MSPTMLIVRIAGETVAFSADAVESVVDLDAITPVPRAPPHVAGLAPLRSRVLTVIDARAALGEAAAPRSGRTPAVVLGLEGHGYAIVIDEVLDVVDAEERSETLQGGAAPAWAAVAAGTATIAGGLHLVIDPARLIAGPKACPRP
jgi:purine-binding chemotaxis protein CheW